MRRDLFSAVSFGLLVSFICTSSIPAFALKPQETAEKPAGLEELADKLLAPFVPSPQETTRRGFLTSVAAGAAAAALPSSLIAAEKLVEKPIAGARVKFDPKEITLSDLPAGLVKGRTAVLVFIENDNNPAEKEPGVWYVQPNNVDGAWYFPVRGNAVSVTTKREDHRAFRKGHVWVILLKDEAAVKAFREKVRTLPGHQGAEADTYLAQRNREDLTTLLKDAAFVEKTSFAVIAVDSDGKAAQLVSAGLEEQGVTVDEATDLVEYLVEASQDGDGVKYVSVASAGAIKKPSQFSRSVLRDWIAQLDAVSERRTVSVDFSDPSPKDRKLWIHVLAPGSKPEPRLKQSTAVDLLALLVQQTPLVRGIRFDHKGESVDLNIWGADSDRIKTAILDVFGGAVDVVIQLEWPPESSGVRKPIVHVISASGLEENLTVSGALTQISQYVQRGSVVVKYRGVEFSDMVAEITPKGGLFNPNVLRKAIMTVAKNGLVRVESAGDGTWILPPAIVSSSGVAVSVGAYELDNLAPLGEYGVSQKGGSLADRVDSSFGRRIMDFDQVRAVGFYPPGFGAYSARNLHYVEVVGSGTAAVAAAAQRALMALGEIYPNALNARSLELRTGSLWAPGINGPVLLIGPTGVASGLEEGDILVNTFNRHETHPDVNLRPVTLAPPPGGILLLQWASEVPTEENSRFALVRVPPAEDRSAGIQVLDQLGNQFQPEQFTAAGSQGLDGMQVPYRIRVTAPWETAGKKGNEVAVASPESIALQWNPANGSLQVQNLPAGYVFLAHRLESVPVSASVAGMETEDFGTPSFVVEPGPDDDDLQGADVKTAGLEETGIGSLPTAHQMDTQFTGQFLSGRVPTGKDASLLETQSIPHAQLATEWIGVVTVFEDLIGAGRGLDTVEKRGIVDQSDIRAQEIQDQVARAQGVLLQHVNFETKGLTPGGLQAGAVGGDPKGVPTPTISDVIEHTTAFMEGDPGASSMQMEGPGAETFGSFPDEARALMVVTRTDPAKEAAVLRRYGVQTVDELLDPELPVDQLVRRVAELNGVHSNQVDVTLLTNDDADLEALRKLQQTYTGLRVHQVKAGTVVPALAAVLGVNDGRVRLFLRRSGMTEGVFITLLAGLYSADGSYANFRVVSEEVKSEFSRRYVWNQRVLGQMEALRPNDWMQIRDGKKIFSSRQATLPVTGVYTFLTNGRTDLDLPFSVNGVRQDGGVSEISSLVFTSHPTNKGAGYLWLSRNSYTLPAPEVHQAGLEEMPAPMIGFLSSLADKDADLSRRLLSGNSAAKGQATKILSGGLKSVPDFDQAFGRLLALSRGNMEVFAQTFERFVAKQNASVRDALLAQVRRIAQDPGAPNNIPPISYFNPARYVYARLQQNLLDGFVRDVLSEVVETAQGVSDSVDLSDVWKKKDALVQKLEEGRLTKGPYQYEIFWDSLVRKDGETYLTLELLLDGEQGYEKGVVLELQVVIPAAGEKPQYRGPYSLQTQPVFSVGLLDPIHFINTRFPEWRPKAQRDIYESRLQALRDSGEKDKRQFIRPSERQGNNPRFFEPFFRAFLDGNVPLAYHIVDALASERDYGNQGGVGSVGNLASAIVRRGGIGATASWLLEEPDAARIVAGEKRTLVYSYEKDHHRIDAIKNVAEFASELEPFLLAYPENLMTGWVSANLEDETKFINPDARKEALKAGETIVQTGVIDETVFGRLQETYNGKPVTEGLPNVFGMHWLRNRWLHDVVDTLAAQGVPITPFNRWYIEPDYALDGKPQTVEELAYLTLMSWVSAQAQGHPLGPVVPSYGNVHGASAGNPSLALAGILQYAAQAAPLYGEPLPADLLAIARKAPRGSIALAEKAAGYFKDLSLREKFLQVVTSAGERTEEEEAQLRGFVLAQLQKIPSDVLKTLKEAEQVLLKEVGQAQKEKRQPQPLETVAPAVAGNLGALTARLDREINTLPLERRAAITTHAASGLSAEQLSQAREYGVWVANKSTEFQNIITKQLEVVYLMAVDPSQAQVELSRMSAAQAAWKAHPLSPEELQRVAALYQAMYDAAAARAIKAAKTDAEKEALRQAASNPLRLFPWFWRDNTGWSMEDPSGKNWSAYDWVPGAHGRYMFSMRDKMTGHGTENRLLFPNALTWGLPPTVIRMAQAEIERTIHFYHAAGVMKASGGAQQYWNYMESKKPTAGLEEVAEAIAGLDSHRMEQRLAVLSKLVELEKRGVQIPTVGPVLPSYIHVHTTASYPDLPGVFSPTRMVWAAHQAGAGQVWLVDHETLLHIEEGSRAVQIVNQGARKLLTPVFGVEFKAPVSPSRTALLEALRSGVAAGDAAWVVAWGVPVDSNGKVPAALADLVAQFQAAKRKRAINQALRIQKQSPVGFIDFSGLLDKSPDRNVTDRQMAYSAAREELGLQAGPEKLNDRAARIRKEILAGVPLSSEEYGFPTYEQTVSQLASLGMVPTFTMQVSVPDLVKLTPELREIGIRAFDLAGIEHQHPNAFDDINSVITLAKKNSMPVVGGVDFRGDDAVGWPQAAAWMQNSAITASIAKISGRPVSAPVLDAGSRYAMDANPPPAAGLEEKPATVVTGAVATVAAIDAAEREVVSAVSADLKDAALVLQASKTGKVGQIITDGDTGSALVLPAASLSPASNFYRHTGLQGPVDLPGSVTVEDLPETQQGVLDVLGRAALQDSDLIVLNADLVGEQAAEWIPALTTNPGRLRITPEQSAGARTQDLAAAAHWSRLLGGVVDYGSLTVTYVTVRDTTYAVIRSA